MNTGIFPIDEAIELLGMSPSDLYEWIPDNPIILCPTIGKEPSATHYDSIMFAIKNANAKPVEGMPEGYQLFSWRAPYSGLTPERIAEVIKAEWIN